MNNRRCNFCGQGWVLPIEEELECGRHDIKHFDFPIAIVFAVIGFVIAAVIIAVILLSTGLPLGYGIPVLGPTGA